MMDSKHLEVLEKTVAALDKIHRCSVVGVMLGYTEGAMLGYTEHEKWAENLYCSHQDASEALKEARELINQQKSLSGFRDNY